VAALCTSSSSPSSSIHAHLLLLLIPRLLLLVLLAPTQIPYCWCVGAAPGTKKPPWGTAAGAIMGASTFSGAADMGAPEGLNTST